MRFTVSSAELKEQLLIVNGAIASNPVLPILESFLFRIEGTTLTIVGTDLETYVTSELSINSTQDGSIAIPAKILVDTLKQLPPQPITFSVDMESFKVDIIASTGRYELAAEDGDEFPKVPVAETTDELEIPAALLLQGVNKTLFATSSDELRPAMTGVLVKIEQGSLTFVATDAHKLVKYQFHDLQSTAKASFIVPKKALTLLTKALSNASIQVQISYNKSNAFFYFGNQTIACRLIDAKYPDFEAVIPKNNPNMLQIQRGELLTALKRLSNFANQSTHQVRLQLSDSSLTIEAEDIDFQKKATEQLSCDYKGNDMRIGFNARFLIDMLGVIGTDGIRMEFSTPNRAGVMRPDEDELNEELLMLAMPMMIHS